MILDEVTAAEVAGARLAKICELLRISPRTIERWRADPHGEDRRRGPGRSARNALTPAEEACVVAAMQAHPGMSPKQLVAKLADEGIYIASESTMYRLRRRGSSRIQRESRRVVRPKMVHRATGPNQVWSWDITWLPTSVRGKYVFLYLVMDVWSRRVVGWRVHTSESSDLAAAMIREICAESGAKSAGLILHSDNGTPMRGSTMLATLQWLGIVASFSRPHVSDDNPYSEALFRTLKHGPAPRPWRFHGANDARTWVGRFVAWYNGHHRHSGIRYVTPNERHFGREAHVLGQRVALYEQARRKHPERWSGKTRNWTPIREVVLNPEPVSQPIAA